MFGVLDGVAVALERGDHLLLVVVLIRAGSVCASKTLPPKRLAYDAAPSAVLASSRRATAALRVRRILDVHQRVARLKEAASCVSLCLQRGRSLSSVSLVERRFETSGVCTRSRDCGVKTCPRGVAQFEVGDCGLQALFIASDFSHWRARSQHRTRSRLTIHSCRDDQQIASLAAFAYTKKQALQITAGCKLGRTRHAVAAINNHDARRDDDATHRKTRKNVECLRAPTLRTEVRVASSKRK